MFRRLPQVALLVGAAALAGQASAHGHDAGPAIVGAVVGAVVGGAIVASRPAPVYVEQPAPVYAPPPRYYGPRYYGPPHRWGGPHW